MTTTIIIFKHIHLLLLWFIIHFTLVASFLSSSSSSTTISRTTLLNDYYDEAFNHNSNIWWFTTRHHSYLNQYNNNNSENSMTLTMKKKYNQQLGEFEPLNIDPNNNNNEDGNDNKNNRIVKLYNFSYMEPIQYQYMWDMQKEIVNGHLERLNVESKKDKRRDDNDDDNNNQIKSQFWKLDKDKLLLFTKYEQNDDNSNDYRHVITKDHMSKGCDSILFLQHQPVYTLGTASDESYIHKTNNNSNDNNIDVIRIERGGEVTYHGPGQLTVYPIFDLRGYKQDIHWYMRALEEVILLALHRVGIDSATRENDVTGVWVNGKKIAALGVKVRRWVTMHGIAVNVDERSIANFSGIVPCGLEGRDVCCINDFLDKPITVNDFTEYLKAAFEDIFEVKII